MAFCCCLEIAEDWEEGDEKIEVAATTKIRFYY